MGFSRRWWLNQGIHSRVASSSDSFVFQGARRWLYSALYKPLADRLDSAGIAILVNDVP